MSRTTIIWVLLLVLITGLAWYFFSPPSPSSSIKNYPSEGTDIIAFGDSLVYGSGASEGNDFVSLLSKRSGQTIVNLGVPGNTTADGLARIHDLDQYHPKVVILLLGGNDYLKRVPSDTTFENLRKIIEYMQAKGAIVLLLGVKGSLFGDKFAPQFDELHRTYNTAFVSNVLEGLFDNPKYMADEVHPNDAGNKIIADRVYPVLLPLLQ